MPPQLKTLIPAFAIFILSFLVIRYFLTPASFGDEGHYRYNSVQENKNKPMHYAGKAVCAACHEDMAEKINSGSHTNLSCETCHGPGLAHIENTDSVKMIFPREREFCGLCHKQNLSRKDKLSMIDLKEHNPTKKCIECHNPHMPWEIKEENTPDENL